MRIAHFGTFDVDNYGDLLFPLILEKRLNIPGCEFVHISPTGRTPGFACCLPTVAVHEVFRDRCSIDAVILGGGHLLRGHPTNLRLYQNLYRHSVPAYVLLWWGASQCAINKQVP